MIDKERTREIASHPNFAGFKLGPDGYLHGVDEWDGKPIKVWMTEDGETRWCPDSPVAASEQSLVQGISG